MDNYDLNNHQNDNQNKSTNESPNNNYGQNNNGYGQNNNGYGQNNNGYGQNNNGYCQNNNGYGQNGYPFNNRPVKREKDSIGTASMIFGIIGLVTSMNFYFCIPCSITAIVLAILSRNRKGRFEGKTIAGLCLSISALVLMIFFFMLLLQMLNSPEFVEFLNEFRATYQ